MLSRNSETLGFCRLREHLGFVGLGIHHGFQGKKVPIELIVYYNIK